MSADMTSIANKNTSEIRAKLATGRLRCPQVFCKTKKSGLGSLRNSSASRAVEVAATDYTKSSTLGCYINILQQSLHCCIIRWLVNFYSRPTIRIEFRGKIASP